METRPRKLGRSYSPDRSMVGQSFVWVIVALMGVSKLMKCVREGKARGGEWIWVEYERWVGKVVIRTPGSETNVPIVT